MPDATRRADVAPDGTLEPKLTAWDLKILAALPAEPRFTECADMDDYRTRSKRVTAWELAQALDHEDVGEIRRVLRGMRHRGFVTLHGGFKRNTQTWTRTWRGDDYLKERGHG